MTEVSPRSVKAKNLRRLAGQVLQQLHLTSRLHQMYSGEHENVRQAYDALAAKLAEVFSFEDGLRLSVEEGYIFANEIRLRADRAAAEAYDWVLGRFLDSGIASVAIGRAVKPVELRKFLPIFAKAIWPEDGPPPPVGRELSEAFVLNIRVAMRTARDVTAGDGEHAEVSARQLATAVWLKLHRAATDLANAVRVGAPLALRPARYLIQLAVDTLLEEDAALLAAARQKNYLPEGVPVASPWQGYLENHLVNTCVYALALGNRLGLARRQLLDLGTAALAADLGMALVPAEVREKMGPLAPAERALVERHPLDGAEALLRADEPPATARLCAVVAAEHHPRGYPLRLAGEGGRPHLFSSIVAIADAYDAMTTDRPWRDALAHDVALRALVSGEGGHDRLLAKAFANVLGLYPAGSVVELASGEIGVIVGANADPRLLARPRVKLLIDAQGRNVGGRVVDTAERGPGGAFVRTIDRVIELGDLASGPGDLVALL